MQNEPNQEKEPAALDSESYRNFLAGNRTLFAETFWNNAPRPTAPQPTIPNPNSLADN